MNTSEGGNLDEVTLRHSFWKLAFMAVRGFYYYLRNPFRKRLWLVGQGVRIRNCSLITSHGRLILEDYCELQGLSREGLDFGRGVSIGAFSVIRPSGYYSRKIGRGLKVGHNSNIGIHCYIGCGGGVTIGCNVMMGPMVSIHSENHNFDVPETAIKSQGVSENYVVIEDDCWLAAGARILAGVRIGKGSVVAAGAVVNKDVPPGSVVAGVPATVVSTR